MGLSHGKAFYHSFSSADAKRLYHEIIPPLVDDHSEAVISHYPRRYK